MNSGDIPDSMKSGLSRGIDGAREDARAEAERAKRAIGSLNKDVGFFTDLADSLLTRTH